MRIARVRARTHNFDRTFRPQAVPYIITELPPAVSRHRASHDHTVARWASAKSISRSLLTNQTYYPHVLPRPEVENHARLECLGMSSDSFIYHRCSILHYPLLILLHTHQTGLSVPLLSSSALGLTQRRSSCSSTVRTYYVWMLHFFDNSSAAHIPFV